VFFAIIAVLFAILVYFILKPQTFGPIEPLEEKWWGEGSRQDESTEIIPFQVEFSESRNSDLLARLRNTRYFESLENAGWRYGTRPDFMKIVVDYWVNKFSWRNQVDYINQFDHFKTSIDGISMHFLHIKPTNVQPGTKVLPIILIHGWPGSFFEFHKAIPKLLAENDGYAFELVIPSLPGYGYSSPPKRPGLSPEYIAIIMNKLMLRLGYKKYYVQGGDWGSEVSRMIARLFPQQVKGMHVNLWAHQTHPKYPILTHIVGAVAPSLVLPDKAERDGIFPIWEKIKVILEQSGYFHIQATTPDTVAFGLNDSPAGLASYILEKFVYCFDGTRCPDQDVLKCMADRVTLDELLTNIMIYWDTNSMPTAVRLYKEMVNSENTALLGYPVLVPVGVASFPHEIMPPPKSWVEASCSNLVSFTVMKKGGHFGAFEEPDAFSEDVRQFVYKVEALPA